MFQKNLTIGYKRHHVSLSTGGGLSDLLAWEEQGSKSATQAKKKNFLIRDRKTPRNLKCNYNRATVILLTFEI